MPTKACGTCRDRKVLCDRTIPFCRRCSGSRRKCQGYGIRLSWPKEHDHRRTIVCPLQTQGGGPPKLSSLWTVNASTWDFQLQDYISAARLQSSEKLSPPVLPASMCWRPFKLNHAEKDLLQYFSLVTSYSLTPLGYNPEQIRHILLRLALSDSTTPAMAVMQSLLGLTSLHRFGPQSHAAGLKISALQTLAASLTRGINAKEGIQYIAAGMLLCSYEAHQSSDTSEESLLHIRGAKDIISAVLLRDSAIRDTDFIPLLDWVFYHDCLSRFSVRHWRRRETVQDKYNTETESMWCSIVPFLNDPQPISSSRMILCCLSHVCDVVVGPADPIQDTEEYRSFLRLLYWEMMRIPVLEYGIGEPRVEGGLRVASGIELCRLAVLVYLERVAGSWLEGKSWDSNRIERAFALLNHLVTCEWPFPLLIFACEARTDDQRITVLHLISRTQKNSPLRILDLVKSMIQSVWVQDDLADQNIGYLDKLSFVLSSSGGFPIFA